MSDRMRVTFDLPDNPKKARLMRKWFRHLEETGEIFSYMEAMFECETDEPDRWVETGLFTEEELRHWDKS